MAPKTRLKKIRKIENKKISIWVITPKPGLMHYFWKCVKRLPATQVEIQYKQEYFVKYFCHFS